MNIVKAETNQSQEGTVTITQTYIVDASDDFLEYTEDYTDDEIIEAGQDKDYLDLNSGKIESTFWGLIRGTENVDYTIMNVSVSLYNNPNPETVEQAIEFSKKLQVEVQVELAYSPDYTAIGELEKNLIKSVVSTKPKATLEPE